MDRSRSFAPSLSLSLLPILLCWAFMPTEASFCLFVSLFHFFFLFILLSCSSGSSEVSLSFIYFLLFWLQSCLYPTYTGADSSSSGTKKMKETASGGEGFVRAFLSVCVCAFACYTLAAIELCLVLSACCCYVMCLARALHVWLGLCCVVMMKIHL